MDRKKQRNTRQKKLISDSVTGRCDHPTADDIYLDIHDRDEHLSKGTIYRNLNMLAGQGEIKRFSAGGADRYDANCTKHCHFRCTVCGKVTDAPIDYNEGYDSIVSDKTGFIITGHNTVFEGICSECMTGTENKKM